MGEDLLLPKTSGTEAGTDRAGGAIYLSAKCEGGASGAGTGGGV